MRRRKLLLSLLPGSLLSAALVYGLALWVADRHLSAAAHEQQKKEVEYSARTMAARIAPMIGSASGTELDSLLEELTFGDGAETPERYAILQGGEVLTGGKGSMYGSGDIFRQPEIREALQGRTGFSLRKTRGEIGERLYVAVPLGHSRPGGVLSVSVPAPSSVPGPGGPAVKVFLAVMVAAAVGGVLMVVSRKIVRPLEEMGRGAGRLSGGDLSARVVVPAPAELASLAEAMNRMASEVGKRLEAVMEQRNEMEAVLTSMVEGVVAVDSERKIISMNRAAFGLLGVAGMDVKGRSVPEVIRDSTLARFIAESIEAEKPLEKEMEIMVSGEGRFLQAHGSMLKGAERNPIGALVVLNDVTRLRKLESVRRDFVINASHEIRTPVTSIKGFVETLLEGALEERENVERFLRIISRHADRLMAIVEDLLNLSRIERESERGEVSFEEEPLDRVVEEAVEVCAPVAKSRDISLVKKCQGDLKPRVNSSLLVQAVINLVDNAIKYSDPGRSVEVSCGRDGPWATIEVRDEGSGIASEHLPRLFERFYRVDKARSRSLGGTGLGLAIVKHIVQAHRGSVIVDSEEGKGSVFTIFLPMIAENKESS